MEHKRLTVAGIVLVTALGGCGHGSAQGKAVPLNVDVATARRQNIATYIALDGQIAPLEQSTLAFQQSAPITAIYVNVGDVVSKGQVLAKIDASTLQAELAQAVAQASQQSATARGAQVGLPVQVQQNQATLTTAQAALSNAKLVYDQDVQLFKQGYVSQSELESAHASYVQAQNAYQNAQIGLRNNTVSEQNVKASVAGAKAAIANANTLRTEIAQTTLYAPYDGVITERLMDPGAFASPQAPVLAISRVDKVWININVPDTDLPYVHPGSSVSFTSSSLPGRTFAVKVGTVNAVPTAGTLSYLARIEMPNPGDVLRGGMLVSATMPKQQRSNVIVVPRTAIAQAQSGNVVYIVGPGNKAQAVPVQVGIETDTLAQVTAPQIHAGTKVITTRPDALKDGSLIAIDSNSSSASAGGAQ
jgi:HlyD family secretion protein